MKLLSFLVSRISRNALLATGGVLLTALAWTSPMWAQTETILYSFCPQTTCTDGSSPEAGLAMDANGNFYGTTVVGGAYDEGTVFKVTSDGAETLLHSFNHRRGDGTQPAAPVILDAKGNLYGTASTKGAHNGGVVFKVALNGRETILYNFCSLANCADGNQPLAGLVRDKAGNLYGTTLIGGAQNLGTVFKLTPSGVETVLHSFGGSDGSSPWAGLVMDGQGNLYGTTYTGGDLSLCNGLGCGTVFKVAANGTETVLHSFCSQQGTSCTDGMNPRSGLLRDKQGNLYGTAYYGGTAGNGIVFKLALDGTETVVYNFQGTPNDAGHPVGGLLMDSAGNLFGTTYQGGIYNDGSVFEINNSGTETVLHSFGATGSDGFWPMGNLLLNSAGNLVGATNSGGATSGAHGMVFTLTP